MKGSSSLIIGGIIFLSLAAVGAYAVLTHKSAPTEESTFTSPVVGVVENKNLSIGSRITLENDLRTLASTSVEKGELTDYGIYYRELISGPAMAIRETRGFFPASLLKIPVAMWYFKHEELTPGLLKEEIEFTGPRGISVEHFPQQRRLEEGRIYTVEELIELMLAESDNDATAILVQYAGGREVINEIYNDVGIDDVDNYDTYVIDTHSYAAFFRVLYNAELLSEASSARILEFLSKTSFSVGLTAELPSGTMVAHKFGERTIDVEKDIQQLHDCGIIYAPQNPYMLCVMTQGTDYDRMAAFIADVSQRVYAASGNL